MICANERCGAEFEPVLRHPHQKYCSTRCSNATWKRTERGRAANRRYKQSEAGRQGYARHYAGGGWYRQFKWKLERRIEVNQQRLEEMRGT